MPQDLDKQIFSLETKIVMLSNLLGRIAVARNAGDSYPSNYRQAEDILGGNIFERWYGQLGLDCLNPQDLQRSVKKIQSAVNIIQKKILPSVSEKDLDNLLSPQVENILLAYIGPQFTWNLLLDEKLLNIKLGELFSSPHPATIMEKFQKLLSLEGRHEIAKRGLFALDEICSVLEPVQKKNLAGYLLVPENMVIETLLARAKTQTKFDQEFDIYSVYHIQKLITNLVDQNSIEIIHLLEHAWKTTENTNDILLLLGCELSLQKDFVRATELLYNQDTPNDFKSILDILLEKLTSYKTTKQLDAESSHRKKQLDTVEDVLLAQSEEESIEDGLLSQNLDNSPERKFQERLAIVLEVMNLNSIMEDGTVDFSEKNGAFSQERYFPLVPIGEKIPQLARLEDMISKLKENIPNLEKLK